jgi:DNA-binding IscR family transcriptional regulator
MALNTDTIHATPQLADGCELTLATARVVLRKLSQAGVVKSVRGVNGGFALADKPGVLNLWDVIGAFDAVDPEAGDTHPVSRLMRDVAGEVENVFRRTSISDFAKGRIVKTAMPKLPARGSKNGAHKAGKSAKKKAARRK